MEWSDINLDEFPKWYQSGYHTIKIGGGKDFIRFRTWNRITDELILEKFRPVVPLKETKKALELKENNFWNKIKRKERSLTLEKNRTTTSKVETNSPSSKDRSADNIESEGRK